MAQRGRFATSPECPECGSTRTRARFTGIDEDGRTIRLRICTDCDKRFGTVEVILPDSFSFRKTDTYRRRLRSKQVAFYSSDRILMRAPSIIPGRKSDYCRSGKHSLTGSNLKTRNNGERRCVACSTAARRAYYMAHRVELNRAKREIYHARKVPNDI